MKIEHLVIVLGKRLQNNELTAEGRSRVDAVIDYISSTNMDRTLISFCGGITGRQVRSEASAMHEYYVNLASTLNLNVADIPVLLEQKSTSTIENIRHLASEIIESDFKLEQKEIKVTFVSNAYHLERIFEIQQYLDEQGLLKTLKATCLDAGLKLNIPYQLEQHICVPYPKKTTQADLFLAIEALTTYRVYLEGVVATSFTRQLADVRRQPLNIALSAFERVDLILRSLPNLQSADELSEKCAVLRQILPILKQCVQATHHEASLSCHAHWLAVLDVNLTMLNRLLDPETEPQSRWWR